MATPTEAPVGEWKTPITSEMITSKTLRLSSPSFDAHGRLYWLEGRPAEAGREVLVTRGSGSETIVYDVTPGPDSGIVVRTRVHEYGGGEYLVVGTTLFFSNFKDQRLYHQDLPLNGSPGTPTPVTAEGTAMRFADFAWDELRQRLVAVAEYHDPSDPTGHRVDNSIVAIDPSTGAITPLTSGHDFYSNPRVSPDGSKLCWICWDFPNMPWDGTQLMVADVLHDGSLTNIHSLAGGAEESVQQPVWGPNGSDIFFISDSFGWWNIYCYKDKQLLPVHTQAADFGWPQWKFGISTYQVLSGGHILALYQDPQEAGTTLGLISPGKGLAKLHAPFSSFGGVARVAVSPDPQGSGRLSVAVVGGGPRLFSRVAVLEGLSVEQLASSQEADWKLVKDSAGIQLSDSLLSVPRSIEYPTDGGLSAHLLYYAPTNPDYVLPAGVLPPLMVLSHGGPTSSADVTLNLSIQYYTSRGFGVANVDYGGSTGYGRSYRNRLRGTWGIVDVADCSNAALHLAHEGLADPRRLCISGGSAGGFTTLACLAFRDTFAAGASLYGVADLELLAKDTHKFESRYLDMLVGAYPEQKDVYQARSPIHHVESFSSPIIFFQGDKDAVVPPNQAVEMHEAVRKRGLPTALLMFPGEDHGFRQAGNIRMTLDGMMYFLGQVLGFTAAMPEDLQAFDIDNLKV